MNFRPTTLKLIVSIVIGLFDAFFFNINSWNILNVNAILNLIVVFIVIYIIWSLIQKKK